MSSEAADSATPDELSKLLLDDTNGVTTTNNNPKKLLDTTTSSIVSFLDTSEPTYIGKLFVSLQLILVVFFCFATDYTTTEYEVKEYIAFRDIMVMLLLGFGYLMTFLKYYGLSAVGFTMMLSVLSMECNILVEFVIRYMYSSFGGGDEETGEESDTKLPLPISLPTIIDSEFAAATLMITFGAIIGRATPTQMVVVCVCQSFFYAINKVVFVLGMVRITYMCIFAHCRFLLDDITCPFFLF